ncbi:hypothetical protein M409DRAFT_20354 [Zasmidium cellare ATCC 36951]|uniref:SET domain-containing protein n=1 Tax=Zasmidium cellare ATCC 36951 TaxID=1080233 RepID=A0A6A6CPC0_ZASCE|nr:uncharacterized protein M409DRAFT_20354 [Zasmidium cellare ATCC 36951]KAF2169127.1 hypothetical protein M409DRAFT_20354 [Zasmidium cellare ATCC 36951]
MTQTTTQTTTSNEDVTALHSKESAYPLTINSLQNLVAFVHTPAGLCVVSKVSLPAGAHFAYITSHEPQPSPIWKTIQTSATTHTDPQSALLYMNHSCAPSLEVHTFSPDPTTGKYPQSPPGGDRNGEILGVGPHGLAGEVRVARDRGIAPGDALTFFYPSTEWEMDRGFECLCGAPKGVCLAEVKGSKEIERKDLGRWFFNEHILRLAAERDGKI